MRRPTYRIRSEYSSENPIYRFIDEVIITRMAGDMADVIDIHDGNEFRINIGKLEVVRC